LEHVFAHDPYRQMGGYVKRMLGLNLYIKVENAAGLRIQELFMQGQPLKADRLYTAAFVTAQGVPEKYGSNRRNLHIRAIEALQMHISVKSHTEIGPCRTVRGEKNAVVEIVPQVFAMVRFARIFLCDSPFSSNRWAL
jgi:hypothetical protein